MPLKALKLGLLVKSESTYFYKLGEYTFSHLALQEFLAALYVSSEVLQTDADMATLETICFDDGHLAMFWVFLAGLLEGTRLVELLLDRALSGMTARLRSPSNKSHQKLQLFRCYTESMLGRSGTPSASIGKCLNEYQVDFSCNSLSVADCAAICTVLQCHRPQTERMHNVCFNFCDMTDAGLAQLLPGLQMCKFVKIFSLSGSSLSRSIAAVSDVIANNASTLEVLFLGDTKLGDNGLEKLAASLKQCRKLKELHLDSNGLTSRSGATLADVLCKLPTLEQLWVDCNQLGDSGMKQLAHGLKFCTRLQKLDVSETALSSRAIPVLRPLLASLPALQLGVGSGDFSADEMKRLHRGRKDRVHSDLPV